jgi:hypothetical protein
MDLMKPKGGGIDILSTFKKKPTCAVKASRPVQGMKPCGPNFPLFDPDTSGDDPL